MVTVFKYPCYSMLSYQLNEKRCPEFFPQRFYELLPKRLALTICEDLKISGRVADMSKNLIKSIAESINKWTVKPTGTEGYRTAEVTLGGVNTNELSSKTMMSKNNKGLYFIGEVVDVTGHLGGYNFQWAWSSGYVAGQYV